MITTLIHFDNLVVRTDEIVALGTKVHRVSYDDSYRVAFWLRGQSEEFMGALGSDVVEAEKRRLQILHYIEIRDRR